MNCLISDVKHSSLPPKGICGYGKDFIGISFYGTYTNEYKG